ncbi:MAG: hypothetical protein SFT94_06330 [Pseudanabaenaceae cyanobacterium bins.68]|nr:hypothetical protein [Pseudanabaenaceae cyanobacterium bins.68]
MKLLFPFGLSAIAVLIFSQLYSASAQETSQHLELNADRPDVQGLSFEAILAQAQQRANQAIALEFSNPGVTALRLTVSLTRKGLTAPILYVAVDKAQWQQQPSLTLWARSIPRSGELLGYFTIPARAQPAAQGNLPAATVYSSGFFKINRPANQPSPRPLSPPSESSPVGSGVQPNRDD